MSTVHKRRRSVHRAKDPLSYEYVLVEDQRHSMRFERESPNPIWWSDYTRQEEELTEKGSTITYVETPDVDVICVRDIPFNRDEISNHNPLAMPTWTADDAGLRIKLRMQTEAEFPEYAICIWGLPEAFDGDAEHIETNANEFILAKNTDGERHLVLVFDLKPELEIDVLLRTA